jgi:excisionase family DNA binding protein
MTNMENPFAIIISHLERLEGLIEKIQVEQTSIEIQQWMNLMDLCDYLPGRPARSTVYTWVHFGIIPFHKKGKKLYFLKSEIDAWLREDKKLTSREKREDAEIKLIKANKT